MAVALNDLFSVQIRGQIFNQRVMLTHWYAISSSAGAPPSELLATLGLVTECSVGGGADLVSPYAACLPPQFQFIDIRAQKVAPVRFRFQTATLAGVGTHANNTEATNQAATIEFATALAGRDQISIKHIGPLPQDVSVQDEGLVTAAYKALLDALADNMELSPAPVGTGLVFTPVIAHKTPVGSFTIIVNHTMGDTVRTMRRRTVRVGE